MGGVAGEPGRAALRRAKRTGGKTAGATGGYDKQFESPIRRNCLRVRPLLVLFFFGCSHMPAQTQCAGEVSSVRAASDCTAASTPQNTSATLDANHTYTLAELIDIAEHNNPRTRIVWERAKQKAAQLGIAKSAYYPLLAGIAAFADQRIVNPFPKPLAPDGYTMVQLPVIQPELTLQYLLFDGGERAAHVDAATQEKLAAGANFIAANQEVAFRVASAYYRLLTAQERLQAAEETLKTARTTLDAAEERMNNDELDALLTPVTVDPAHPFPRVIHKALCQALLLRRRRRSAANAPTTWAW